MAFYRSKSQDLKLVSLGTDPELEMVIGSRVHRADNQSYTCRFGAIGRDGDGNWGNQVELRPKAASDPLELVENIKNLLRIWRRQNRSAPALKKLGVKGDRYSLGGHIHFGFNHNNPYESCGCEDLKLFTHLLDLFYGRRLANLCGTARERDGYKIFAGDANAVRLQKWGFEYRVPPSSFLAHPEFCRLVFTVSFKLGQKFWAGNLLTRPNLTQGVELDLSYSPREGFGRDKIALTSDFVRNEILNEEDTKKLLAFIYYYRSSHHINPNDIITTWLGNEPVPEEERDPRSLWPSIPSPPPAPDDPVEAFRRMMEVEDDGQGSLAADLTRPRRRVTRAVSPGVPVREVPRNPSGEVRDEPLTELERRAYARDPIIRGMAAHQVHALRTRVVRLLGRDISNAELIAISRSVRRHMTAHNQQLRGISDGGLRSLIEEAFADQPTLEEREATPPSEEDANLFTTTDFVALQNRIEAMIGTGVLSNEEIASMVRRTRVGVGTENPLQDLLRIPDDAFRAVINEILRLRRDDTPQDEESTPREIQALSFSDYAALRTRIERAFGGALPDAQAHQVMQRMMQLDPEVCRTMTDETIPAIVQNTLNVQDPPTEAAPPPMEPEEFRDLQHRMIAATRLDISPDDVAAMLRADPHQGLRRNFREISDAELRETVNAFFIARRMAAPLGDLLGTSTTPEYIDRIRQMARELGVEALGRDIAQPEDNARGGGQWVRIEERNLVLIFRDEWNEQIRNQVVEFFRRNRWSRNRSRTVKITLYGLNQERGSRVIACSYQGRRYPSMQGHARFYTDVYDLLPGTVFIEMNYTNSEHDSIDIGCCRGFRTGDLLATDWEQYLRIINRTANYVSSLITRERAQGRQDVPVREPGDWIDQRQQEAIDSNQALENPTPPDDDDDPEPDDDDLG